MDRLEILLTKLINGEMIDNWETQSRLEEHLLACINKIGIEDLGEPQSRAEELLQLLAVQMKNNVDILQTRVNNTGRASYLFYKDYESDLSYASRLDISQATEAKYLFAECENIRTLPTLDYSNATDIGSICNVCLSLVEAHLINTSNVQLMTNAFRRCEHLASVSMNASSVTDATNAFSGCTALKSIVMEGMKASFDISASIQFEAADLVALFNSLGTATSGATLTMGATNLAKLTDEEKAIATNKGWALA